MKIASFSLLSLAFLLCLGFAFAGGLSVTAADLDYKEPLKDIPEQGLELIGESSSINCGVFECDYTFKVYNKSGSDLSDLVVKPYFSSQPFAFSIKELVEETYSVPNKVCINEKPVEGGKGGETECIEWKEEQTVYSVIVEKSLSEVTDKGSRLLDSKDYVLEKQALVTLQNTSTRVFKVKFSPNAKVGQLVFVAESPTLGTVKGSLDPWWDSNWQRKKAIKISTKASEVPIGYVFNTSIGATNTAEFSDFCDDIRIVDENTNRDLNIAEIINCNTVDTNVYWQFDGNHTLAKNKDYNTTFYLYYKNSSATAKADWNNLNTIDVPFGSGARTNALWHFDNNAMDSNSYLDSSPNGRTMTESGSAPFNFSNTIRKFGRGYSAGAFGGGRYLLSPSGALPSTTRGVLFWYYPTNVATHQYVIISAGASRLFFEQNADGTVRGSVNGGGTYTTSVKALSANQWYHIGYTWDGGGAVETLYINGELDKQIAAGGRNNDSTTADWGRDNGGAEHFTGYLEELTIINNSLNGGNGINATNVLHLNDGNIPVFTLGAEQFASGSVSADFNYTYRSGINYLDPENGLNSVIVDFNDRSTDTNASALIVDWNWFDGLVLFSTDQNTSRTFTIAGDYNIMLRSKDNAGNDANTTKTVTIYSALQGLSITLDTNSKTSDLNVQIDLNYSATVSVDTFWWQKNGAFVATTSGLHDLLTASGDYNYCLTAQATGTDVNKIDCLSVLITRVIVKIPLNEQDSNAIKPFNLSVDTNTASSYTGLATDTNVWIVGLTTPIVKNLYVVDTIGDYFGRYYGLIADATTKTLQPYLIKKSAGGNVKILVKEKSTNTPIVNAQVTLKKLIGGTMTIVEQQYSDSTGTTNFIMVYNDTYYLDTNYLNFGFSNYLIKALESTYTVYIDTLGGTITHQINYGIDANYYPTGYSIDANAGFIKDLNSTVFSIGNFIAFARLRVYMDNNVFFDVNTTNGGIPFTQYHPSIPYIHIGGMTAGHNIVIDWNVRDVNGRYYYFIHTITYGTDNLTIGINNLTAGIGQTGSIFIALFLTLIICGLAVFGGFGNAPGLSILGGMLILVFSFLGFIPWGLAILACIGGFGLYYLQVRQ